MRNKSKLAENSALNQVAAFMATAARTAPKAKGIDNIATLIINNSKDKNKLIRKMRRLAKDANKPGFSRDAKNIEHSPVIVIIGTKTQPIGLTYCSFCGYNNCDHLLKSKGSCSFNTIDLGIAAGSAVSIAANFRIDNRIMYSIGKAAMALNLFKDKNIKIALGIPLSAKGKNPFFDRK